MLAKKLVGSLSGLVLVMAALLPVPCAIAADRGITVYNGINKDIASLRLRDGTVTGFKRLEPGWGIVVGVEMDDGSCGGWLVARTALGDAANALIDVCHGDSYVVTLTPRQNNRGSALDLTIKPLK